MNQSLNNFNLITLWKTALTATSSSSAPKAPPRGAVLCWGKAAEAQVRALPSPRFPALAIPPVRRDTPQFSAAGWRVVPGEHPLPGVGSLRAGESILDFFDSLHRYGTHELDIYLSGGASSTGWCLPAGLSHRELLVQLQSFYRQPWTIAELNRHRARLCLLKSGGAARWLKRLAPRVKARVHVISDVLPFGLEYVGSGPFWLESGDPARIPHRVLADNTLWVNEISRLSHLPILGSLSGLSGAWEEWVTRISLKIEEKFGRKGLLIFGGEPLVRLNRSGKGGRQSQIAAALAIRWSAEIRESHIEILCASSDGSDGRSSSAATFLSAESLRGVSEARLARSIRRFDTAGALGRALIPEFSTGTNVQDVILVRLR